MMMLHTVQTNARVFTRLLGLDKEPLQFKYSSGEDDAYNALDCAAILLKETSRFVGKQKHPGCPFDFVEDVKADMVEMMLRDPDPVKQAIKRKRHLPLFYLIVEPALETLRQYNHATAIENVDAAFDEIKRVMFTDDNYGEYDDALVADAQVKHLIREHDEQTKQAAAVRKKASRKMAKELEAEIKYAAETDPE